MRLSNNFTLSELDAVSLIAKQIRKQIEFMGQEYSYEWVYGFMNALSVQVIEKLNQNINVPYIPDVEDPESEGEELPDEE